VAIFAKDGTVPNALAPIRTLSFGTLVILYARNARLQDYSKLVSLILIAGSIGMLLDTFFHPAQKWIPFPIQNAELITYIAGSHERSGRFGGFTYEAGVIAGMTSIFLLMNNAILFFKSLNRSLNISNRNKMLIYFSNLCGFGTFFLSKTKSGIFIIALSIIAMSLVIMFTKSGINRKVRQVSNRIIMALCLMIVIGFIVIKTTKYGAYFDQEINYLQIALSGGLNSSTGEGAGLATRIEETTLCFYSFLKHPLGGGVTDGRFFTEGSLNLISPTPEMIAFMIKGKYNGYKGAIFNMISQGGILSVAFLYYLFRSIKIVYTKNRYQASAAIAIMFIVAFIALGLSVELIPYIEMILLVIGMGFVLQRESNLPQNPVLHG